MGDGERQLNKGGAPAGGDEDVSELDTALSVD